MICKISVDPKNGQRVNCDDCPVARAINEHTRTKVTVTHDWVTFYGEHPSYATTKVHFKPEIRQKIIDIDYGRLTEPFSFSLDIPVQYTKIWETNVN